MPAHDTSTTGKHVSALDGVRGAAILLVMMFHLFSLNTNYTGGRAGLLVARVIGAGWIGVDIFFALSGFLITGILYDTQESSRYFRNFYWRRTLRIAPLYYGFILGAMAISLSLGDRWFWPGLLLRLAYLQGLVIRSYPYSTSHWVEFIPLWSLAVEEHFYLVWPAIVYFARTRRKIAIAAIALAAFSILVRLYLQWSGVSTRLGYLPYVWTPARLDSLLFGGILALLVRSRHRAATLNCGPPLLVLGIAGTALYGVYAGGLHNMGDRVMVTFGYSWLGLTACALIATVLRPASMVQRMFSVGFLRFFGRYSYGLYLFHFSVLRVVQTYTRPWALARTHSNVASIFLTGFVTTGISILLALLSFHLYEKRFLSFKRHFQDDSPTPKLRKLLRVNQPGLGS